MDILEGVCKFSANEVHGSMVGKIVIYSLVLISIILFFTQGNSVIKSIVGSLIGIYAVFTLFCFAFKHRETILYYLYKWYDKIINNKITAILITILVGGAVAYITLFYKNLAQGDSAFQEYSLVFNVVFSVFMFLGFLALFVSLYDKKRFGQSTVADILKSSQFYLATSKLFIGLGIFLLSVYAITTFETVSDIMTLVVNLAMTLGGLYLLYQFLNKVFFKNNDPTSMYRLKMFYHGFFMGICYIVEKFVSLFTNIKETPQFVNYVLLGEVALIAAYFGLPKLMNYMRPKDEIILQKDPVYLTKQTQVGSYDNLKHKEGHKYNYALSFSVFIDENKVSSSPNASKYTPIMNYGNKPLITYNAKKNSLQVSMLNGKNVQEVIYTSNTFPLQKWNRVVLNYSAGTLDVFINGDLVATSKNVVPYMSYDNIYIGSGNGIRGGIKNVKYYTEPLSKLRIKLQNDLD